MAVSMRLGLCRSRGIKFLARPAVSVNYFSRSKHCKNNPNSQFGINLFHTQNKFQATVCSSVKRYYTVQQQAVETKTHDVDQNTEKIEGETEKHDFQAETRMLLDIVAKSLYSDKEVFIRELISNASDALEKLRYISLTEGKADQLRQLEIRIATDKQNRTLTIQDTGVGMTREELVLNLGTIARSGSKAFLEELKKKGSNSPEQSSVIGQFGVGFYSAFMVADKVDVFTKSHKANAQGFHWSSDGSGSYEINKASGVNSGTKIILHLKTENREFSDESTLQQIIVKYSNFVGSPIYLNGKQVNTIQPLWVMDPKSVTKEMHAEFFRFVSNSYDRPRFTLHYKTDVPLTIQALLYIPEGKPGLFEISRETDVGVSLYSRRVLIKSKAENILPKWLRFIKGVVDSEDIPLNLSRELLQNSALIRKLTVVLTDRILRFLNEKVAKDLEEYSRFYKDYSLFLKEGIVTSDNQSEKEEIAKLLRYESSNKPAGQTISFTDYCSKLQPGQKDIYYLSAPSRSLAESSPYFEAMKEKKVEVLFCYEPHDEIVLLQLRQFDKYNLTSVEKEMRQDKEANEVGDLGAGNLSSSDLDKIMSSMKGTLKEKVQGVKVNKRLENHPCVVTVEEMGAARHFIKTQGQQMNDEMRFSLLQPRLEINPKHPIIKKLFTLYTSNFELAELITEQLFSNAMVGAGLIQDPRTVLSSMNKLLTLALEKH
ncbi:TNF receptor associated protein 1 [Lycorma delicatula]|uniref:TNF receptor associated protein 1 n=1 Tax=Lycorma delicatula TaxID=130591 RepID=UPI003F51890A